MNLNVKFELSRFEQLEVSLSLLIETEELNVKKITNYFYINKYICLKEKWVVCACVLMTHSNLILVTVS